MSPTIVLRDNRPILVIGSPGGSRIISYVARAIVAHLDWGMNIQETVSMPHAINQFGPYELEAGTSIEGFSETLESLGYRVKKRSLTSGLHAISMVSGIISGGADPRREGIVLGY